MKINKALLIVIVAATYEAVGEDTARVLVPNARGQTIVSQVPGTSSQQAHYEVDVNPLLVKSATRRMHHLGPRSMTDAVIAETHARFNANLLANSVVVYRSEAVDRKFTEVHQNIHRLDKDLRADIINTEKRISLLIKDATASVPAAVFEELKKQAAEEVRKEMIEEMNLLKTEIEKLTQIVQGITPTGSNNSVNPAPPTPDQ